MDVLNQGGIPEPKPGHDFTARQPPMRSTPDASSDDPPERPVAKAHISLADLDPASLVELQSRLGPMADMVQIVLDR